METTERKTCSRPVGDDIASAGGPGVQKTGKDDSGLIASDKPDSVVEDSGKEGVKDALGSLVKVNTIKGESSNEQEEVCPHGERAEGSALQRQTSSDANQPGGMSKIDTIMLKYSIDDKQRSQSDIVSDKLSDMEISIPTRSKSVDILPIPVKVDDSESVTRNIVATGSNDSSPSATKSAPDGVDTTKADRAEDPGALKSCSVSEEFKALGQVVVNCSNTSLQASAANGVKLEISDNRETTPHQNSDSVDYIKEQVKDHSKCFSSSGIFAISRSKRNINESSNTSAMDLEFGAVDALEVARLVAQEVERQVGDYEENSGSSSSSEKSLRDDTDSPESSHDERNQCAAYSTPSNELPTVENVPSEGSQKKEDGEKRRSINSENIDGGPENGIQDMDSSQITEAAQEPERNLTKEMCIDLNLEVCSEEADDVANSVSNPVAVVSASRALAAPGLPSSPLKFEGALGWKGSAATSAFRTISAGGTSSGSRQKNDVFIDLNVAEDGDDVAADPASGKLNMLPPGLPSGESSVELSPRRCGKRKFDLNQLIEEDVDTPPSLDWKMGSRPLGPQSSRRSPSPASSSSSRKKPCLRNFDLNDGPSNYNDPSTEQQLFFLGQSFSSSSHNKLNSFGGSSDESVISIMGAKVKKDAAVNPSLYSFSHGRVSEPMLINPSTNLPRTGTFLGGASASAIPYAPSHLFGYNGLAMGPALPFSSGMYGPGMHGPNVGSGAYIVDSRGFSLVPQLIGPPASTPFRGSFPQPSFVPNMVMGSMPDPNSAGPSQPSLDLNSGFMVDGSGREQGGYRQFFFPNQGRLVEEQLRDGLQPPLFPGVVGGKRKEPDGGWGDSYLASYRHHQPPPPL